MSKLCLPLSNTVAMELQGGGGGGEGEGGSEEWSVCLFVATNSGSDRGLVAPAQPVTAPHDNTMPALYIACTIHILL